MEMKYDQYLPEDLKKDVLINDQDFLLDASSFLAKRKNIDAEDPEEIYQEFMRHMRATDVNELDTLGDLKYAQKLEGEDREEMRRLYSAYDRMEIGFADDLIDFQLDEGDILPEFTGQIGDYVSALATAPSTYLGIATGGGYKAGAVAGLQAAKVAVKEILTSGAVRGATKAALVEGGIGAVQGGINEGVRVEIDPDREFTGEGALTGAIAGAIPGVVVGGTTGYLTTRNAVRAAESAAKTSRAIATVEEKARIAAINTVEKITKTKTGKANASKIDEVLRPIDPDMVARGEAVRAEELPEAEYLISQLSPEVLTRLKAAVLDVADDIEIEPNQRVTEAIVNAWNSNKIDTSKFTDVMQKYNISGEQLGYLFAADFSQAGRTLQLGSQLKKSINKTIEMATEVGVRVDEQALEEIANGGNTIRRLKEGTQGFERMRRAVLTSQIRTTTRNFVGGGARVFLDIAENFIEDKMTRVLKSVGRDYKPEQFRPDSMAIARYLFDREEADLIISMYSKNNPQAADRIFQTFIDASDLSSKLKTKSKMEAFGLKINFLNKMADNYYKKAIFAGQLQRLVKAKYGKSVIEMMEEGTFNKIDPKLFDAAGDKAFELVYQLTPSGKGEGLTGLASYLGKQYLNKVDTMPGLNMLTGLVMPFPRFVINQIKFMYEHAPVLGLIGGERTLPQKLAQFSTGMGLVGAGILTRAVHGTDMEWYHIKNDEGKLVDVRPLLGPFNMFLYLGDYAYRANTGQPVQDEYLGDIAEMAIGSSLRAGTGKYLVEQFGPEAVAALTGEQELSLKTEKMLGQTIGDYLATFGYMMPISVARDLYSLTDEEADLIPETRDGVSFFDIMMLRATRALPTPVREYMTGRETKPRFDITATEPSRADEPVAVSVTGAATRPAMNTLERELARLKMSKYDLYRPVPFGPADAQLRKELSQVLPTAMKSIIDSDRYKNAPSAAEQRDLLNKGAEFIVGKRRSAVFDSLREQARKGQIDLSEEDINKFEFESEPKDNRKAVKARFKKRFNREIGKQEGDWALANELMSRYKKSLPIGKYAEGGMVGDPLSLSETLEEEDTVAREEAGDSYVDEMISLGLDMAPVTGEIRSAQSAVEDFEEGNYGMAALGALGAVPGVGIVGRGAKAGIKALRTVDKAEDIAEAKKILGDEDAIQAWKDTNRLPESQRQKRNPIVQQAAQDLKDGNITGKEYRKIAKAEMPMRPITRENFPEMPTLKEVVGALTKDKSEKGVVGLNVDIPDGTRIGSRLDIPAYDNYDTWIVSLHDGTVRNGKAMGYGQTAVLDNVEFFTEGQGALNIATKKPKAPIARIHGDYKNEDPEAVYNRVYELMDDPEWTQVGMNPFRHSFFYDKATGNPVTRADQVLQVGPLVLAKGARSELSDLKKLKIKSADGKTRVYNKGGLMSRK